MSVRAYYNEIDPYAAQWLGNLAEAGHIAPGHIDTRSILDVRPADLDGFAQCHFFAGIAGWSLALRLAGIMDDASVWTGSCPCQPFSAAGRRGGFDDARHLWPVWFNLIRQCRPTIVFGEQVASKDGLAWLDAVHADLEAEGYAVGAADLCAASAGAPHIRQRIWFVAYLASQRRDRSELAGATGATQAGGAEEGWGRPARVRELAGCSPTDIVADHPSKQLARALPQPSGQPGFGREGVPAGRRGDAGGVADSYGRNASAEGLQRGGEHGLIETDRRVVPHRWTGAAHLGWDNADWLRCRDDRWRPVEAGTFPLATGIPARVGRLRAYGNSIVPQVAAAFIGAAMDALSRPNPADDATGGGA